jgi:hypothetical protein
LIRTQPPTVSADPSTRADDVTPTAADADGKLPGQIWDSNAAASITIKEAAATSSPPIAAFLPLTEITILKLNLAPGERTRYERTRGGLVGKSYARGHKIQAHCCPGVDHGVLTTAVATRCEALVEL